MFRPGKKDKIITFWVLLTSVLRALFKVFQLRNYSLKKFNTSIFDALSAQFSIKI